MQLFEPETFQNDPYVAGLNQMGHAIAGAALGAVLTAWLIPAGALIVGFLMILALELWQLGRRGAVAWDALLDLGFWTAGLVTWTLLIAIGAASGWAVYFPVLLVGMAGAVMLVFKVLNTPLTED